ncbi:MAG TPA: hypothetical protein VLH85_08685 [Levilinea sp.]|nr:hypothetical protein [Levilinea sp.]
MRRIKVADLVGDFVVGESVFEGRVGVFLTIEAFIFDFPAQAHGLIGDSSDIAPQ